MAQHAFRRFSRWAWVLAIFAVGIPMLTAFAIRTSGAHGRLRELAIDTIQEELGLRATLGSVQIELYPFGLVAHDVALDDPIYGRLADAEALRIQPSLRGLLRGVVDLHAVEIVGATVHLIVQGGAIRNIPRIEPSAGGGPPTLPFDELRVRRSALSIDLAFDEEHSAAIAARDVDVTVRGTGDHVIEVEVTTGGGEVVHATASGDETSEPIQALTASVAVSADQLRVAYAEVRIGPLEVRARDFSMPLPPPTDPRHLDGILGHAEVSYDVAHLSTLALPFSVPRLQGIVDVVVDALATDEGPRATGTVRVMDGQIEQFGLGDLVELTFVADANEVEITEGLVTLPPGGGTVALTATLGLSAELPLSAVARPQALSFGELMTEFDVSDNALVEWIFDGALHLEGPLLPPAGQAISLSGPIDLRTHDFVVTMDGFRTRPVRPAMGIERGHFTGSWSIRDDAVRFHDLNAELPQSRILGDVVLGFHNELRVNARAEGNIAEVAPLAGFDIRGVGGATCTIDGTFHDPRILGHVDFSDFEFDGMRLGRIDSDAVLDPDGMGVTFPAANITKGDSRYLAHDLRLDFHHDAFLLETRLEIARMTLADFYHVFGFEADERFIGYQGVARGTADVRYTNGMPGDSPTGTLITDADLLFDAISLNGYAFERGVVRGGWHWRDWAAGYRGGELLLEVAELHKGEGTLTVQGVMSEGGAIRMSAAVDRLELRDIEGIGDRLPDAAGIASAIGSIGGTAERMRVDLDVSVAGMSYAGQSLGDARAYVRMTDDADPWITSARRFSADGGLDGGVVPSADEPCPYARRGLARANWPADPPAHTIEGPMPRLARPSAFIVCGTALEERVALDLMVGRTERFPLRGHVGIASLPVERVAASLPAGVHGVVSGEVFFDDGGMVDPETLDARLLLSEVSLTSGAGEGAAEIAISNMVPVRVNVIDGVAHIERARFRAPGSRLRVRGEASIASGLGLEIESDIDLALLPSVNTAITDATGILRVRLAVTGPFIDPQLFGEANLENGSLGLSMLESRVEDLHARVTFSSRRVVVEDVGARVAGGSISGAGEATLERRALDRWSMRVRADHLSFIPVDGLELTFSADTRIDGGREMRLPAATGDILLERLVYSRPIEIGTTLADLTRTERAEVTTWRPSEEHVTLDLHVTEDTPLIVRNNLVDAELRIDEHDRPFRIVGTDQRFGVLGDLRFDRGRIFFRNTAFEVVAGGSVIFDDDTSIDPRFDVHASTEMRRADMRETTWRILLDVSGTSDSLRLATHSDPEMPQEDILLLLAVGMTRAEVEAQAGDVGSTAALEALASVTGVDREVRRALPVIDDFRLGSAYSTRTSRTEPQITIGKRIADRIRLSATTGISEARDFRAVIEAQLDDTTSVSVGYDNYNLTSGASFGNFGADLRWRLSFE